ncbi:hypothetical protein K6W36_18660, partial [Acetobacter senegalensis]|nr:hypothetical protein [Acetobacter senegalensis]
ATPPVITQERESQRKAQNQRVFRTLQMHRKKSHLKPISRHFKISNAGKSVIRSRVERIFVNQKFQTALFIQSVGISHATMRIMLANIVYSMHCFYSWSESAQPPSKL